MLEKENIEYIKNQSKLQTPEQIERSNYHDKKLVSQTLDCLIQNEVNHLPLLKT